jgi:DNA-binding Lrp family transcriptional regulator
MIEHCWNEVDRTILDCLRSEGPMSPGELGRRIGMSESETTSFLALLIHQGTVKIELVQADGPAASFTAPSRPIRRKRAGSALKTSRRHS